MSFKNYVPSLYTTLILLVMLTPIHGTGLKNGVMPTEKDFELAARKLQPTLPQIE